MTSYVQDGHLFRRLVDDVLIPVDVGNADYQALLSWQADGGVIEPPHAPDLDAARAVRDAELVAACAAAITAGITSNVTGAALFYPTLAQDQANLTAVVVLSTLPDTPPDWAQPLTTRDAAGVWARRSHTAAQVQAVGRAVAAHVDACRARLAALRGALAAVETPAAVAALTWQEV